jgi:hypothetical protein
VIGWSSFGARGLGVGEVRSEEAYGVPCSYGVGLRERLRQDAVAGRSKPRPYKNVFELVGDATAMAHLCAIVACCVVALT